MRLSYWSSLFAHWSIVVVTGVYGPHWCIKLTLMAIFSNQLNFLLHAHHYYIKVYIKWAMTNWSTLNKQHTGHCARILGTYSSQNMITPSFILHHGIGSRDLWETILRDESKRKRKNQQQYYNHRAPNLMWISELCDSLLSVYNNTFIINPQKEWS